MARKPNDVELVIKARNESEKAFASVSEALKAMETAAKQGGGLSNLFQGFQQRLEAASSKQKEFNALLGSTKEIQKQINAEKKLIDAFEDQAKAVDKSVDKLKDLESTYQALEQAANQVRKPSEKLAESLSKQQTQQKSLEESIARTKREIQESTAALNQNAGADEKATAAIIKQQTAVSDAGKSWREMSTAAGQANRVIKELSKARDNTSANLGAANEERAQLEERIKQLKEFVAQTDKLRKQGSLTGSTARLASDAKKSLDEAKLAVKTLGQTQATLRNELSAAEAAIRRQETVFGKLTEKAKQQKSVYDSLKSSIEKYEAVARAEGTDRQTKKITALNAQLSVLQTSYDQTVARVERANQALAKASTPDPKSVKAFDALKQKIEGARAAVVQEQQALSQLENELRTAGVSTEALKKRQQELDTATEQLVKEEQKLTDQMSKLGAQAGRTKTKIDQTGNSFIKLGKDTRQSLSYLQRIRGELLSIASTYTGVYAVGSAIRSIYESSVQLNKAQARLGVFFDGDAAKVAEEIRFVTETAKDLRIEVDVALDQYSKFASGIDQSQVPLDRIRKTFIGFSTAARVGRLSGEELERVFNALTQIFGKQQLQTEELKGQLGDVLPGAVQRTAKALGLGADGVKILTKQMEQGNVTSQAAILLADELYRAYAGQLPKALEGADAAVADFQNTLRDIRLEIADSGFLEELVKGLKEVTKEMSTPEFKEGAKKFAKGLSELFSVIVSGVKHIDEIAIALSLLFGVKVFAALNSFRKGFVGAGKAIADFGTEVAKLKKAGPVIGTVTTRIGQLVSSLASLRVLAGGAIGFAFGTWLYQTFEGVQKFAARAVGFVDKTIAKLKMFYQREKAFFNNFGNPEGMKAEIAKAEQGYKDDAARIDNIVADMIKDIEKQFEDSKSNNSNPGIIDIEAERKKLEEIKSLYGDKELADLRAGAIVVDPEELQKKIDKVKEKLATIDAEIQKKSGDTLQERIDAIRNQYEKLIKDINGAGGFGNFEGAQSSIDQIVAIKQVEAVQKEINDLIQERRTMTANINEQAELGAITVEEATKRINEGNARIIPQMTEALSKAREIADQIKSAPITADVDTIAASVALEQQRAKREQILALENQINRVMAIRNEQIQTINAEIQSGSENEVRGRERILTINRNTAARLKEILAIAIEMAETMGDQQMLERLKQVGIELSKVKDEIITASQFNQQFANGFTEAFDSIVSGSQSAGDAMRQFFADMLKWLAKAIIQWVILKAIQNSGAGGAVAGFVNAGVNHTGGVVGQRGSSRKVPLAAFAGAVRYHSGGIAGLKPNEVPTILEKGEEVLTAGDPRHSANGGASGQQPVQVKIVNTIDAASFLNEALSSPAGQKTLVNAVKSQKSSIKSVLR